MNYYRARKIILIFKYLKLIGQSLFIKVIQNNEIFIKIFKFLKKQKIKIVKNKNFIVMNTIELIIYYMIKYF